MDTHAFTQGSPAARPGQVTELHTSAHLMTLGAGLYCISRQSDSVSLDMRAALPAVCVTLPPTEASRGLHIAPSCPGGWLVAGRDAVLVRVDQGAADVLVTVYRASAAQPAPKLQVQRLSPDADAPAETAASPALPRFDPEHPPALVAHIQRRGDVGASFGEWLGEPGSFLWMEGFSIATPPGVDASEFEYQGVLGRDWLSPWVSGGQFCGSRGMALPLLGLHVRLRGAAATAYEAAVEARFCDGSTVGPLPGTAPVASAGLAPLESFLLTVRPLPSALEPAGKKPRRPRP